MLREILMILLVIYVLASLVTLGVGLSESQSVNCNSDHTYRFDYVITTRKLGCWLGHSVE